MLAAILLVSCLIIVSAYFIYGRFLDRHFQIDSRTPTPAHTLKDGVDYVPTHKMILLGHHFSSIAGAGPIVGPIIASLAFGWLPVLLWVILGAILIGGVHDYSTLVASIRHQGRSISEIARQYMNQKTYLLFLGFVWLALVYVLTVFIDLTSTTFTQDGGVATASILFMGLAIVFGLCLYRFGMSVLVCSLIFVPLVFVSVWVGQLFPLKPQFLPAILGDVAKTWDLILIAYCFMASVAPVWLLLQPRDYLSSYLLYVSVIGGFMGILLGGINVAYPAFTGYTSPIGSLFPILFITVACGACSGFHALVSTGTSSKQLKQESDSRLIGYGALLIEAVVAVIALCTVAMVKTGDGLLGKHPLEIYASGMSVFLNTLGIPPVLGRYFGLLAISTFILTTLDTATRLGRYIFEEFVGQKVKLANLRYLATLTMLSLPTIFVLITLKDAAGKPIPAWKAIWPVFGATNQLLAGLSLLVIAVWLKKTGRKFHFVTLPMLFMLAVTIWALGLLILSYKLSIIGVIAIILLFLAILLAIDAAKKLWAD